jgi:hypothetical protein
MHNPPYINTLYPKIAQNTKAYFTQVQSPTRKQAGRHRKFNHLQPFMGPVPITESTNSRATSSRHVHPVLRDYARVVSVTSAPPMNRPDSIVRQPSISCYIQSTGSEHWLAHPIPFCGTPLLSSEES